MTSVYPALYTQLTAPSALRDGGEPVSQRYRIPNTLEHWPFPRAINPYYEECKAESNAWLRAFEVFTPSAQAAFDRCDFPRLASLGFPKLNKDGCRIGCDLMNLFFVIDTTSDLSNAHETRQLADCVMDAIRNPYKPRPEGEWVGGTIAQQYWQNALKTASLTAQRRFVSSFQRYLDAVVQEASDRDHGSIRSIAEYFIIRRDTIGLLPSLPINEVHFDIPDRVMEHPSVKKLEEVATDMVSIGNDLVSWNREQSRGEEGHNLVTVVVHELGLSVQEAFDWIGRYHDGLMQEFLSLYEDFPTFSEEGEQVNREIKEYLDDLGRWVRGNDCWSFESKRYFGNEGRKIQNSRAFELLPKVNVDGSLILNPLAGSR
ncbi:terpenoid synthase [Cladorrhinum sp. PSN332]|nr:terpenoid synthase [Cladorrhinum sp. PSN332]